MTILVPGGTFAAPFRQVTALSWPTVGAGFVVWESGWVFATTKGPLDWVAKIFVPAALIGQTPSTPQQVGLDFSFTVSGVQTTLTGARSSLDGDAYTEGAGTPSSDEYSFFYNGARLQFGVATSVSLDCGGTPTLLVFDESMAVIDIVFRVNNAVTRAANYFPHWDERTRPERFAVTLSGGATVTMDFASEVCVPFLRSSGGHPYYDRGSNSWYAPTVS